jgi:hypothetical protein
MRNTAKHCSVHYSENEENENTISQTNTLGKH